MARKLSDEHKAYLSELVGKVRDDRIHRFMLESRRPADPVDDGKPKPPPAKPKPEVKPKPEDDPKPKSRRWGMYADDTDDDEVPE